MFITFEGIEGCGKSTQSKALKRRLVRRGRSAILVKEPGTTAVGRVVRQLLKHRLEITLDPVTEMFLFEVARAQLVSEAILPALQSKRIVICDRFGESTLAYQGYARGMDLNIILNLNDVATKGLRPDLIVLIDIDAEAGLKRKGAASVNDRFEREELPFHQRVRKGYLAMSQAEPERWLVIDGSLPPRDIGNLIWSRTQRMIEYSCFP